MINKIMVVDDDPTVVRSVKMVLETTGYNVIGVGSGQECLNILEKEDVDLVFLDIMMPEMDGIETLRNIKRVTPGTYVIMLTAFGTADTAVKAMKAGAFDYINKPFKVTEMQNGVLGVLEEIKFETEYKSAYPFGESKGNCFEAFKALITDDAKGICIARGKPEIINEEHGLKNVTNIWLTQQKKKNWICIDPEKIDELELIIDNFITKNPKAVILIHDINYLVNQNSLEIVRKFIYALNKKIGDGYLILSTDLKKTDAKGKINSGLKNLISDLHIRAITEALSNVLRRNAILTLDRCNTCSFTKIAKELGVISMPKLSFHLRELKRHGIITQDDERIYFLTETGKDAAMILKTLGKDKMKSFKNVIWMSTESL